MILNRIDKDAERRFWDKTLDIAYKEYMHFGVDIHNIQLTHLKYYLTISSLIIGFIVALTVNVIVTKDNEWIFAMPDHGAHFFCYGLLLISAVFSIIVFINAARTLRGGRESNLTRPFITLSTFISESELQLARPRPFQVNAEIEKYQCLARELAGSIDNFQNKIVMIRDKLRCMALLIVLSGMALLFSVALLIIVNSIIAPGGTGCDLAILLQTVPG